MAESFASLSMSRRGREGGRHGHRQRLVLEGTSSNKTTPNPSKQLITWGPGMQIYEPVGVHLHPNHHDICPSKNVLVGEMARPVKCQVHHMWSPAGAAGHDGAVQAGRSWSLPAILPSWFSELQMQRRTGSQQNKLEEEEEEEYSNDSDDPWHGFWSAHAYVYT